MTPSTLAALKALAEGATPGPYRWQTTGFASQAGEPAPSLLGDRGHGVLSCDGPANGPSEADARYIAAASPDVVLALVAEVERLRAALEDEYAGWAYSPEHEEVRVCIGCIRQDAKAAQRAATWDEIQHLPGCALRSEP